MVDTYFDDPAAEEGYRFLIEVGTLAHGYGVSSSRLQAYLERVAVAVGLEGRFEVTPASILFIAWQPGDARQRMHYEPMPGAGVDLTRLSRLSGIMDRVQDGSLTVPQALEAMEQIQSAPPTFGAAAIGAGYALCGAGFAVLMSLGWLDVLIAAIGSLAVFGLGQMADHVKWLGSRLELVAGLMIAVLASLCAAVFPGSDRITVALCGLVVLLPGFGLTVGVAELASGLVASGMQRLAAAMLSLLKLFFGAVIGNVVMDRVLTIAASATTSPPGMVWAWVFVVLLVAGLGLIFQARPKDFVWIVLGGLIAYAGILVGSGFGPWQGSLIGAFGLGFFATLFALFRNQPTSTVTIPAVMVLVPGATALLALQTTATDGLADGVAAEWQVVVNIGAILAGLLLSYAVVSPKTTL